VQGRRRIGRTPFHTGRLALGCVTFGREIDEAASFRIMDHALACGMTLFDTADAYGGGQARLYRKNALGVDDVREVSGEMHSSEKIIGRWLRSTNARGRIVLQTKTLAHGPGVTAAIEASLERLQTDHIDLYLLHRYPPADQLESTLDALQAAIRAGKICAAGFSNLTAAQLRDALGLARFEVTQPAYNLLARDIEAEFLPLCRRENIGVVGYSPLGAGFLTGKYLKGIPRGSRFDVIPGHADIYCTERNRAIVRRLAGLAGTHGIPIERLALCWALQNPDLTAILVGARTSAHLDNAVQALRFDFPAAWFEEMNRISEGL
jgi:aryl-alcohol dehydrogenase-like predicted oxidoreductase